MTQDYKVKMSIEEYVTQKPHNGRRGSPRIESGMTLYCIRYDIGGYFTYSYLHKTDAELAIRMMKDEQTDTKHYYDFNMVREPELTKHVGKLN